jgi:peroxiredoxin
VDAAEGGTAPPLVFPDLDGRITSLSDLLGKPSIFLFWNPACGFCQQMVEDVKAWEKKLADAGKELVVISTGTVGANRSHGFRARILLDQEFTAGKAFGVGGTPSAISLDEGATVVSKVAVGKQEIVTSIFSDVAKALSAS